MKSKKIALTLLGVCLIIAVNIRVSGSISLADSFNLKSLLIIAFANGESSSGGCSMCGSGDSTCSVSCDGGKTWTPCTEVKGIEVVD